MSSTDLDLLCINTVRTLSMDAVQKAESGHPGTPMALAPLGYVLFTRTMRHDPADPHWPDRDRFVLSCGHASMLLYSLSLPERLRPDARGPEAVPAVGEPHAGPPGVRLHAGRRDDDRSARPGHRQRRRHGRRRGASRGDVQQATDTTIVDHYTYFICSDGDLMEGISHEAACFAGHLQARQADRLLRRQPASRSTARPT